MGAMEEGVEATIDHVVLAVADLDEAGARLRREHGLGSMAGGVHPRWGTENRIVPLGDQYLELLAVVDPDVGAASALGRALLDLVADGRDRWYAVCVAVDDIGAVGDRLGLGVEPGVRTRPDGVELRWRGAGLEDGRRDASMPFFIEWDVPAGSHPGRTPVDHDVEVGGIAAVEVSGDVVRLAEWLGPAGASLPIGIVDGPPGVRAVELDVAGGERLRLSD